MYTQVWCCHSFVNNIGSSNHTWTADIKPDNVLVNYQQGDLRFADVELADCGSAVRVDSMFAKDRDIIGAPIWRSPEAQLQIGWGTPTDIWSLGTMASAISAPPPTYLLYMTTNDSPSTRSL